MIPSFVAGKRKLSLPGFSSSSKKYDLIMANHRPRMRMNLGEHRAGTDAPPVHSSSTTQSAGSPSANFNHLLLPLSTRFNVGHGKAAKDSSSGASSSNKASPKKPKDKKKGSKAQGPASSPTSQTEQPLIGINE